MLTGTYSVHHLCPYRCYSCIEITFFFRYTKLVGMRAVHPFRHTTIPIIADNFVDKAFGSGAVKITPAHSKTDHDVSIRHLLPLLQVINEDGHMINAGKFNDMHRYECRDMLIVNLENLGLMRKEQPHEMSLPTCSRTGDIIEHLPKEQWFLNCRHLNEKASELVKTKQLEIFPEKFVKNWLQWTGDDRDWCISRQLWWGHQIPAYKCTMDGNTVWVAAMDEKSAKEKLLETYKISPNDVKIERDTDVLDTWFSSGIYPFAALGWPDRINEGDYSKFYPLSLMVTAHDILGFWVHRMVILGLELTGNLPFNKILLHGVICDSKGAKMSKSRGNVIDPIDVINGISLEKLKEKTEEMHKQGVLTKDEMKKALAYHKSNFRGPQGIPECGVDALRFTLLSQDIKSHFVNFDVYQCNANKLFCNKMWQAIKYTQLSFEKVRDVDDISIADLTYFDKWILSRLSNMVEKVNHSMDRYDFHLATKDIRTLIYSDFCDVYLEATKPGFMDENPKVGYGHAHTLSAVLNTSLRCLAPFMIYVTAELIPKIPSFESNIIYKFDDVGKNFFDFPRTEHFAVWQDHALEKQVDMLLRTMNLIRAMKGLYGISNKIKPSVVIQTKDEILYNDLTANEQIVLNLTRSESLGFETNKDINYVKAFLDKNTEIYVEITDDDADEMVFAAREKLEKRIKKLKDSISLLEDKYSSTHYLKSVPEWMQNIDREKLLNKKQELVHLERMIEMNKS